MVAGKGWITECAVTPCAFSPFYQFVNRAIWVKNYPDRPITHRLRGFLLTNFGAGPISKMFGLSVNASVTDEDIAQLLKP